MTQPVTEAAVRGHLDAQARPPGSLGRIEDLAVRLALISQSLTPRAERLSLLVFAGDHGLTQDRVSAYPAEITQAMVVTLLAGRASANAFARAVGAEVRVVDAGVDAELAPHPALIDAKVARGTRNAAREPAMSRAEVELALARGAELAVAAIDRGADILALGEMGIGNSASAALLMHRLAPAPIQDCVGVGAGHDAAGLAHKLAILTRASERSDATDPLEVLRQFGGLEIAMMAGAIHGAADRRTPVIVDGFICTAAALAAMRLRPEVGEVCLFAHRSAEAGHDRMLKAMAAEPLLDLGLRLGEGTGALLAAPLVRAAAALLADVASLDDVLAGRL
ncbi:nicotinate-nucleotide--dimethylbenzimidazole phosphoribosyltransferase [Phenylobacterium sp.]|uniref:nicotinate-nucleotide--dimethylbenzimidazole phosphoribosyltransferase n=1 Tax=Phenylobacterium sp. TaxID=1871053 RepID=UPI002730C748|nr:nicotinate-nucleotide--dimethylbenzimidazole phosphoribosyltransferase [Phenylobacterium sp.]MDP1619253.1 nicotinate-nucleotide--dimethylbenzimidazole phosphoribosyltransferase [Phenylobacterium sp.]MDP1989123.1 nicotinate-nucleotide--dimethylbenzimidazole phosphoribosyltransferase [Phenylobacterium sp.]